MMDLLDWEDRQEAPDLRETRVHRDNREQRYVGTFCKQYNQVNTEVVGCRKPSM